MTRDEILAMSPGRELDALVAEKVMGYKYTSDFDRLFKPSTDVSAAMEILEKMKDEFSVVSLIYCNGSWECGFSPINSLELELPDIRFDSPSLPEAICIAALLAVIAS